MVQTKDFFLNIFVTIRTYQVNWPTFKDQSFHEFSKGDHLENGI